jgi:hypothetical protein
VTKLQYGILSSAVTLFAIAAWQWRRHQAEANAAATERGELIFSNAPLAPEGDGPITFSAVE